MSEPIAAPESTPTAPPGCSATLHRLATALAKAQGAMDAAKKESLNPHFRSRYADLASVWEAIRAPLSANGLSVVQRIETKGGADGGVDLETLLLHESGEWIGDRCWLPVVAGTPQGFGSAITYARRYALMAMVGIAPDDDDDGNLASAPRIRPVRQPEDLSPPIEVRMQMGTASPSGGAPEPVDALIERINQATTEDAMRKIAGESTKMKLTPADVKLLMVAMRKRISEVGGAK